MKGYQFPSLDVLGQEDRHWDDASGYISGHHIAVKLSPPVKCDRCDRLACHRFGGSSDGRALCLRCRDDWADSDLLDKHKYRGAGSKKRWNAAYEEFLTTKPVEEDIYEHNKRVLYELKRKGWIDRVPAAYY